MGRKLDHTGDPNTSWQALLRLYFVGKNITVKEIQLRCGISRSTVQRLIALPGQGIYSRKRWRAKALNNMLCIMEVPPDVIKRVNLLAAREEGYLV